MTNTLSELIESYRTDRQSSFLKLSHGVRVRHERLLSQITREHGACSLKKIRSRDLLAWHEGWLGNGKIAKAQLLAFNTQVAKAHENVARIFAGVNVEKFLEIGISGFKPFRHHFAVHQRHDDIGDHQTNR